MNLFLDSSISFRPPWCFPRLYTYRPDIKGDLSKVTHLDLWTQLRPTFSALEIQIPLRWVCVNGWYMDLIWSNGMLFLCKSVFFFCDVESFVKLGKTHFAVVSHQKHLQPPNPMIENCDILVWSLEPPTLRKKGGFSPCLVMFLEVIRPERSIQVHDVDIEFMKPKISMMERCF